MRNKIGLKNIYLLLVVITGLVGLSLYSTYALFTSNLETNEVVSLTAIDLSIDTSSLETYKQLEILPLEQKTILIKLNNSTDVLKYYKLWYQMVDPTVIDDRIIIAKEDVSLNNTNGAINNKGNLEVRLIITNYHKNSVAINLGVETSNDNNFELDTNKHEINDVTKNNTDNYTYSTLSGNFPIGECTKFAIPNINGVYRIELWGSNGHYTKGDIYLESNKAIYVCVGKENFGNGITSIMVDAPNKEWYLNNSLESKIMMTGNNKINSFILNRKSYNDLKNNGINYSVDNPKYYYFTSSVIEDKNIPIKDINDNNGYAKITINLPRKVINVVPNINKVYIDGSISNYPTNGAYSLTGYTCSTITSGITWDNDNYSVYYPKNAKEDENCDLYFTSNSKNLLINANVGDYVSYVGVGGITKSGKVNCTTTSECTGNSVKCDNNDNYNSSGWRIAYIGTGNTKEMTAYLISAGATECSGLTSLDELNNIALKYCNSDLIYGENCDNTSNPTWLWLFNSDDYTKIINQSSNINNCNELNYNDSSCGFNNNLIDIDGNYKILSGANIFSWNKDKYGIIKDNTSKGIRPIIKLKSNIIIKSGKGTEKDPYIIENIKE